MTEAEVSRTAMNVALARAHLTWMGVVDDPYAEQMLVPRVKRVGTALRLPGLRRLGRRSSFPYLAARTLFFDRFVTNALDDGVRQVVIVAAGYDSRAWRLARPGVSFFEVDRPATQADKRSRAPEGGPAFIPLDATDPQLGEQLDQAGLDRQEPTAFLAEGLAVYMEREAMADLLRRLHELSAPGSRLAVSFEAGFSHKPVTRRITLAYNRRSGELYRFRLRSEDAPAFVSETGWTLEELLTGASLKHEHLDRTDLAGTPVGPAFMVLGSKTTGDRPDPPD